MLHQYGRFKKMAQHINRPVPVWAVVILAAILVAGCSQTTDDRADDYLIRVGNRVVTVADFQKAFENVKPAYSHSAMQDSATLKSARVSLLNQMVEELLLLKRAEELQIGISDSEFQEALEKIKTDYPEGVFDQMLLEYAVSYRFWKERLKVRLLMEKVVARELADRIVITAEDIATYYKTHYHDENAGPNLQDDSKNINEMIVNHLRREKAEQAYRSWIKQLRELHPVKINRDRWDAING